MSSPTAIPTSSYGLYCDPALRDAAIAAGAHAVIPKPIPGELVKQLFG